MRITETLQREVEQLTGKVSLGAPPTKFVTCSSCGAIINIELYPGVITPEEYNALSPEEIIRHRYHLVMPSWGKSLPESLGKYWMGLPMAGSTFEDLPGKSLYCPVCGNELETKGERVIGVVKGPTPLEPVALKLVTKKWLPWVGVGIGALIIVAIIIKTRR